MLFFYVAATVALLFAKAALGQMEGGEGDMANTMGNSNYGTGVFPGNFGPNNFGANNYNMGRGLSNYPTGPLDPNQNTMQGECPTAFPSRFSQQYNQQYNSYQGQRWTRRKRAIDSVIQAGEPVVFQIDDDSFAEVSYVGQTTTKSPKTATKKPTNKRPATTASTTLFSDSHLASTQPSQSAPTAHKKPSLQRCTANKECTNAFLCCEVPGTSAKVCMEPRRPLSSSFYNSGFNNIAGNIGNGGFGRLR